MGCQRKAWDNEGFLDAEMSLIIAFQTKEPLLCISYTTHSSLKFGTGEKKCLSNDTTKVIFMHRYTNVYHVGCTGGKWELIYWTSDISSHLPPLGGVDASDMIDIDLGWVEGARYT